MAEVAIQARPRAVVRKGVKRLRAAGIIPANIFGPGRPSLAIELDGRDLRAALSEVGPTTLVRLHVAGEETARPVLLRGVARKPSTHEILHLDFYQMLHGARVRLALPLHFFGEAPAAHLTEGAVVRHLDNLEIEGVPGAVPTSLAVDVSRLEKPDDSITVRDLAVPEGVTVLTAPDTLVAKVAPGRLHTAEGAEKPPEAATGAAPAAKEA